jgi:signal transduction histidine kinase
LTNILVNVVSNAIKFTNKGGVNIYAHWLPDSVPNTNEGEDEELTLTYKFPQRMENQESLQT